MITPLSLSCLRSLWMVPKENGPFLVEAKEPPFTKTHLVKNDYGWHKVANLLYVDNPIGTGFSHNSDGRQTISFADDEIASHLKEFILEFLKLYPYYVGYKSKGFGRSLNKPKIYLFGESYGGTYVIKLANELVDYLDSSSIKKVSNIFCLHFLEL